MPNLTRKYKLIPVGDKEEVNRVYTYLRGAMENQNKAMNQYMTALYVAQMLEASKEDRKELNKYYSRIATNKKGSAYTDDIVFAKGLGTPSMIKRKVNEDFGNAMKKGLMHGRISLPTYRQDNPILIQPDLVRLRSLSLKDDGIYHKYDSPMDLINGLEKDTNPEVYIKFPDGITFKIVFGNPHKGREQRKVFENIFSETYKVCGSSIEIDKNRKIILNLCLEVPKQEHKLDENVIVGVDVGIAINAMCALNNNYNICEAIGDESNLLRVKNQMNAERKRLQEGLKFSKGGHGRKKKLKALDRLKDRERNFTQTYNHKVSNKVVEFALRHNASQINIEDLSGFGKDRKGNVEDDKKDVLRSWCYYELQNYITYKAQLHGIIVRKVNKDYTSQTCSCCGQRGIRLSQSEFMCQNPDCKCHTLYGKYINADFNAARNIAMSTDYK